MKRRRLYYVIIPLFLVACVILAYSYYNKPEALANPSEHGPWNVEYILRKGVGDPHEPVPTLFLKGRSQSGTDILLTIERLPNGERIQVTCPIPDMISPKHLTVLVYEDHCTPNKDGFTANDCCMIRSLWHADVHVYKIKDKGYFLTIAPKDVGMLLSYLTDAHTLYLLTKGEVFTFRVAEFAEFYDKTLHPILHNGLGEQDPARAFRQAVHTALIPSDWQQVWSDGNQSLSGLWATSERRRMNMDLLSALKDHPDLPARIINYITAEKGSKAWTLALGALNRGLYRADLDPGIFDSIEALRADSTFMTQVRLIIQGIM